MKYTRIVTHDDLDGVVSAALCSLAEGIDDLRFAGPGSILDMGLGVGPETIVCDLPHHPAAGRWFDHHAGNLEDFKLKGGDPVSISGRFQLAKSCARVVFDYYREHFAFPEFIPVTVEETDRVDSFDYGSVEDWRKETPGRLLADTLSISFPSRREREGYMRHLMRSVRSRPLEEVLKDPRVQAASEQYRQTASKNLELITRIGVFLPEDEDREVVILDTTPFKREPNLIKSLAFLVFRSAKAVLEVKSLYRQGRKTNELGFSMSLSPSMEVESSEKDVGEIMRALNIGDGHRGAGAGRKPCASKSEMLKHKESMVRQIFSLWKEQRLHAGGHAQAGQRG
ncbi:MAG: hypothetical protein AB1640_21900 [bacterium]